MCGKIFRVIRYRKFIVFGLVKGFITRIHRYPVSHSKESSKLVDFKSTRQGLMHKLKQYVIIRLNLDF
jgi:hypothetical protein